MLSQGMAPIKELFAKARKGKWLIGADVARYAADLSDKLGAFKKKIGVSRALLVHVSCP